MDAGRCIAIQRSHFHSDSLQNAGLITDCCLFVSHSITGKFTAVYLFIVMLFITVSMRIFSGRSSLVNTADASNDLYMDSRDILAMVKYTKVSLGILVFEYTMITVNTNAFHLELYAHIQPSYNLRSNKIDVLRNIALTCFLGSRVCLLLFYANEYDEICFGSGGIYCALQRPVIWHANSQRSDWCFESCLCVLIGGSRTV